MSNTVTAGEQQAGAGRDGAARSGSRSVAAGVAGVAYLASWAAGLVAMSVRPLNVPIDASSPQVVAGYAGHLAAATVQNLLSEGLPAIALAVVVLWLGRAVPAGATRGVVLWTGIAAVAVSLAQCVLGLMLTAWALPDHRTGLAGGLFVAVNHLDGVKMLLLAALALAAGRGGALPRWVGVVGVVLALSLAASGIGYLLLLNGLGDAAFVSGPILLVWVCAAGLTARRR
ncbi:hypothetical protein [Streptacidiphilus sp. EB129]|uniref:hypothetical protein n=1 Tax=Streptacidiphilus sp. EB129 TaxID=3156262 RepID=UPI00351134B7